MNNKVGKCSICGAGQVRLLVEHIGPISHGGAQDDENHVLICANCHHQIDKQYFTEMEFNHYLSELMRESNLFSEIQLETRLGREERYRADITAEGVDGKTWLIECKRAQSFTPVRIHQAIHQLERYKEIAKFDNYVLAFPGLISDGQKSQLSRHDIESWDAGAIAIKFGKEISVIQHPIFSRIFLSQSSKTEKSAEDELLEKLRNCEKGRAAWPDYQKLTGQILENLFSPPLEAPISESQDKNNVNRRDWIMPNYCDSGFWHFVREKYRADYIVIDAKNYKAPISKGQILQIANYLKPHGAGMFAIIMTRLGADKGADHTIREQWMANGKMILILDDNDVEAMLLAKAAGGQPEKIIGQSLERFRLSM